MAGEKTSNTARSGRANQSGEKRERRHYFRRRKPGTKEPNQETTLAETREPNRRGRSEDRRSPRREDRPNDRRDPRRDDKREDRREPRREDRPDEKREEQRDDRRNDSRIDHDRKDPRRRTRRRRRTRFQPEPVATPPPGSIMEAIEQEYKPPTSVFVYTYVARPGQSGYEFRSDHFANEHGSRVGRRLEDYQIDVSPLFPDENTQTKATRSQSNLNRQDSVQQDTIWEDEVDFDEGS